MADTPEPAHPARGRVLALLETLLHMHDSPQRTAAAFALGVAIGFSPFVGFHTLICLALAFAFNLNRVAVIAGSWVNLPWFMGPYYAGVTALAAWVTGTPMPPDFLARLEAIWTIPTWGARLDALVLLLRPLLVPYVLGALTGAVVAGVIAYRLTFAFISSRRRLLHRRHEAAANRPPIR